MPYCSLADVERLVKWARFTETSKITAADVTSFYIPEADTQVDSRICKRYAVPVVDADDMKVVKYASVRLASVEIARVLMAQANGDMTEIIKQWEKEAREKLEDIVSGKIRLANTEAITDVYSNTANSTEAPSQIWKLGEDQW